MIGFMASIAICAGGHIAAEWAVPQIAKTNVPTSVVALKGAGEDKALADLLKCKGWDELVAGAEPAGYEILKVDGMAVLVKRESFGLDVLAKRKALMTGLLKMAQSGERLVLDPATTPQEIMDLLQPSLDLCSGHDLLADPSSARPFIAPGANITLTNGSKSFRVQWTAPETRDEMNSLASALDAEKEAAWPPKNQAPHKRSPIELDYEALRVLEAHFPSGPQYADKRLELAAKATQALAVELKARGDAIKDVRASLLSALMAKYGSPWGQTETNGVKVGELSESTRDWLEANMVSQGFGSGQDAEVFLGGAKVSVSFFAEIVLCTRSTRGLRRSSVVLSLDTRVRS